MKYSEALLLLFTIFPEKIVDSFIISSPPPPSPLKTSASTSSTNKNNGKTSSTSLLFTTKDNFNFRKRHDLVINTDIISKDKASIVQIESKQLIHQLTKTALYLTKDNNNQDEDNEEQTSNDQSSSKNLNDNKITSKTKQFKSSIKESYKKTLTKFINLIPSLKVAISSFTVGIVLAFTLVFVPIYDSVDKMSEPVTLFETILTDLDQGYVDAIDTKKLFETGMNAMLNSLDPYTEFEGRQEAQDMNEGIKGKYAGVGLVISGASFPKEEMNAINVSSSKSSSSSSQEKGSRLLPKDALDDNARFMHDDDMSSSNSILDDEEDLLSGYDDDDDEDRQDFVKRRMELKRATQKAYEKGIRVVSAFEGYAFDAGMRPGDKIVAVDGWRINAGTPVESVRTRLRGEPGTSVDITIERDGVDGERTLSIPRNIVQVPDVKLTTFVGDPKDGIGYIQLTGFAANAGAEVRRSIFALQQAAEDASNGENSLKVSVFC